MIQANELRIGNWVLDDDGDIVKIECLRSKQFIEYDGVDPAPFIFSKNGECDWCCEEVKGIPLTPEILGYCGFKKHNNAWVPLDYDPNDYNRWRFTIWDDNEGQNLYYNSAEYPVPLKSLHQLQNLYHALTGQELEYNP